MGQWTYGNACVRDHLCLSNIVYQEIWKIGSLQAITLAVNSFADWWGWLIKWARTVLWDDVIAWYLLCWCGTLWQSIHSSLSCSFHQKINWSLFWFKFCYQKSHFWIRWSIWNMTLKVDLSETWSEIIYYTLTSSDMLWTYDILDLLWSYGCDAKFQLIYFICFALKFAMHCRLHCGILIHILLFKSYSFSWSFLYKRCLILLIIFPKTAFNLFQGLAVYRRRQKTITKRRSRL